MKIMNRIDFLALPAGVIYSLWTKKQSIRSLYIKCDSIKDIDWIKANLLITIEVVNSSRNDTGDILEKSLNSGKSFKMDYGVTMRDGLFEDDQLFVVYEKEDIEKLVDQLTNLLPAYPPALLPRKTPKE